MFDAMTSLKYRILTDRLFLHWFIINFIIIIIIIRDELAISY